MIDTRAEIRRDEEVILSMTFEEVIAYAKGARPSNCGAGEGIENS